MSKKLKWNGKGSIKSAMRSDLTLLCLAAAAVFCLSVPTFAQDEQTKTFSNPGQPGNAAKVQELQRVIEEQQRQLDKQHSRNSGSRYKDWPEAQRRQRHLPLKNPRQHRRRALSQDARTSRPGEETKPTPMTSGKGPSKSKA